MISEFSRLLPVQLGQLIRLCELITFRRRLVRSGRKVLFKWVEGGCLPLRDPFHHPVSYPYLTNQR